MLPAMLGCRDARRRGEPAAPPSPSLEVFMRTALRTAALAAALFCSAGAVAAAPAAGVSAELKKSMHDATNPVVRLQTSAGDITLELYKKEAPKSVENFLAYVKAKHYDGTIFHRVIGNFMIQGGGFDKDMNEKPTMPPVVNEAGNGMSNLLGTVAMARTNDPNSATAQFFINVRDNQRLDKNPQSAGYAVFGKVIAGMAVVDKIKQVKTTSKPPFDDVPVTPVVIESAVLLK
jgi:peptidyl-prolyl cis-trans isomerase A (cyclophilin A)